MQQPCFRCPKLPGYTQAQWTLSHRNGDVFAYGKAWRLRVFCRTQELMVNDVFLCLKFDVQTWKQWMFPIFDLHLVKSESGIGQLKFLNGIADGMKLWGILQPNCQTWRCNQQLLLATEGWWVENWDLDQQFFSASNAGGFTSESQPWIHPRWLHPYLGWWNSKHWCFWSQSQLGPTLVFTEKPGWLQSSAISGPERRLETWSQTAQGRPRKPLGGSSWR